MSTAESRAHSILAELGYVLFAREQSGELRLSGKKPTWLDALWPGLGADDRHLRIDGVSPFLKNFLIDAEKCWKKDGNQTVSSGPWVEQDPRGKELQLEATAMTIEGQAVLLIQRLGEAFEAKTSVLQRARETVIAHQRLNSEIQKKQILLHCVADEMSNALANIITSLRLLELEDNGPRTKMLLGLATRATHQQQALIQRVVSVFEDELRSVWGSPNLETNRADANVVLQRALEAARPLFSEKNVGLEGPTMALTTGLVPIDPAQLERVFVNLLEIALDRTAPDGAILVRTEEETESILWRIEDRGPAIPPDVCANLFLKWDPRGATSPEAALRLHFCRIVVENCGGEIGCTPLPTGGNCFWFRLTRDSARR